MEAAARQRDAAGAAALSEHLHQLAGLAGTLGFPLVGRHASELKEVLRGGDAVAVEHVRDRLLRLRQAFAEEVATAEETVTAPVPRVSERLTLCLVEDDPDQRMLLKHHLETAGHLVVALASAKDLIPTARTLRPAAILLDVEMPGLSGYGACVKLKSDAQLRDIPVVFVSHRSTPMDRLMALGLGADDYLCKPVDVPELLLRIKVIEARRSSRGLQAVGR